MLLGNLLPGEQIGLCALTDSHICINELWLDLNSTCSSQWNILHTYIHMYLHTTYIHTYIHMYLHTTYIHTYIRMYVYVCTHMHTYICTYIRTCVTDSENSGLTMSVQVRISFLGTHLDSVNACNTKMRRYSISFSTTVIMCCDWNIRDLLRNPQSDFIIAYRIRTPFTDKRR